MEDRSRDLSTIRRHLDRRRCPATTDEIEQAYDRAAATFSGRTRIVVRHGLPLFRSAMPWRVQRRRFGIWRTQGLHGSRTGFPTRDLAEWFQGLCIRVDARDVAERQILRAHGHG